jgi:microcystin-dependent protein
MPLETGTYISDLNVTNPAHTDGLNQADAHARLIKSTLKATFPNVAGAVSASHTELNSAVSATVNGTGVLKDTGEFFKTNNKDGITNPAPGVVALQAKNASNVSVPVLKVHGDTLATEMLGSASVAGDAAVAGNETVTGNLTVAGKILGPGSVPIGAMLMWLSDTLPADGNWCWANGGTLSRTVNGANLWALWGNKYGNGDGTTTFNVPNLQEVVPVGRSTMGGGVSPGKLNSIATRATLGAIFGADTHTLSVTDIPSHDHDVFLKDNQHDHQTLAGGGLFGGQANGAGVLNGLSAASTPAARTSMASSNITIGSVNGTANDNKTAIKGGGAAHNNVQPSFALNFIIRIA